MADETNEELLRRTLSYLADAVRLEVNAPDHRGGSGYLLARLKDADEVLAATRKKRTKATRDAL